MCARALECPACSCNTVLVSVAGLPWEGQSSSDRAATAEPQTHSGEQIELTKTAQPFPRALHRLFLDLNDWINRRYVETEKFRSMAFLGSAVRRISLSLRPPLSPLCRTGSRSYSSEHTKEKSVPYETTLKQEDGTTSGPTKPLPRSADAVVIGGGSLGCQTVYHLAKMGMTNVVLLERDRLTAGTTWHTAGLLWQLRPSDVEVELLAHTRNVISKDLEEETGLHTGWIQNGGLFIASNKQRLDEYKRLMSLGKVYGIESHVLSPAETKDLYPLMNVDDLYGTLYVPKDGTMDPAGTCTTLTRAASARGATVIENCPVTGIQVKSDDLGVKRVKAVETAHGTIETPCVVNCAGVWATKLGEMAGVKVPLIAMHHAYVVTERIEGIQNMPNVRDHDASVYLRLQGDALSVGGYEQNPIFWEEVSDKFAFSLFDLDWDVFMQHIEGAINRVPVLEQTGIKSTVCGPESFTADHKPLMGEAPEVRGYFLGCGFNSAGKFSTVRSQTFNESRNWQKESERNL
ncbi:hypothetical protein WMY93_021573 [Mugilogobius chulae]|uniref:FAD dependent oxidoreductase domain-containing protein n=1 Tax=Mugilogobius chulae TaxID=88201 RepID=A0AAW0NI82_9GOBI